MGFISVILAANTEVNSLSVLKQKPSLSSTLLTYSHITHLLLVIHVVYFCYIANVDISLMLTWFGRQRGLHSNHPK